MKIVYECDDQIMLEIENSSADNNQFHVVKTIPNCIGVKVMGNNRMDRFNVIELNKFMHNEAFYPCLDRYPVVFDIGICEKTTPYTITNFSVNVSANSKTVILFQIKNDS